VLLNSISKKENGGEEQRTKRTRINLIFECTRYDDEHMCRFGAPKKFQRAPRGDHIKESDFCTLKTEAFGFAKQLKSMERRAYPEACTLVDESWSVQFAFIKAHHLGYLETFGSGFLGSIYHGSSK